MRLLLASVAIAQRLEEVFELMEVIKIVFLNHRTRTFINYSEMSGVKMVGTGDRDKRGKEKQSTSNKIKQVCLRTAAQSLQ